MDVTEKLKLMNETVKPIIKLIDKRMKNKIDALRAYDTPIGEGDPQIKQIREIEAVKLRHEIDVLKDLSDIVEAMYANA